MKRSKRDLQALASSFGKSFRKCRWKWYSLRLYFRVNKSGFLPQSREGPEGFSVIHPSR